jgi:hypothetical protein
MGAGQLHNIKNIKVDCNILDITNSRFINSNEAHRLRGNCSEKLKIEPFKRLMGW